MGTYITRTDLEECCGSRNIAVWSNLDNDDAQTQDARVNRAIAFAERWVEDRLRKGRYVVPLQGNDATALDVIKDVCAKLAGIWLYRGRGVNKDKAVALKLEIWKSECEETIDAYASHKMDLDAAISQVGPSAPSVVNSFDAAYAEWNRGGLNQWG